MVHIDIRETTQMKKDKIMV